MQLQAQPARRPALQTGCWVPLHKNKRRTLVASVPFCVVLVVFGETFYLRAWRVGGARFQGMPRCYPRRLVPGGQTTHHMTCRASSLPVPCSRCEPIKRPAFRIFQSSAPTHVGNWADGRRDTARVCVCVTRWVRVCARVVMGQRQTACFLNLAARAIVASCWPQLVPSRQLPVAAAADCYFFLLLASKQQDS